ncbi:MAG TPA: type II secretion system protein GspM [Candidatus Binatia bacterium]|nr:type II secretion system protein GspM [Candidatus Binatia bacterium]
MIGNLSGRERVAVGLALVFAVVLGGWLLVVEPILEHNRSAAELVPAREQMLRQKRELVARRAAIAADLEATTARFDKLAEGFLTSATPAVAASELQKIVKDMAAQAKTEIRSERILPPADRGELLEIPVEIAVSCEIRQLVDLLSRLDGAPKLLPVQDLKIRVVNLTQPKELLITLTISGFILPSAQGKAKS